MKFEDKVRELLKEGARFSTFVGYRKGEYSVGIYVFLKDGKDVILKLRRKKLPDLTPLIPNIDWLQREAAELFDVKFENPQKPLLLPSQEQP